MHTYRITSALLIGDYETLIKAVFPAYNGEPVVADASAITVTFAFPQTPADLGPLVQLARFGRIKQADGTDSAEGFWPINSQFID